MVINQARPKRKASGARYKKQTVRRQHESGGQPALTKIDAESKKSVRTIGGNRKEKTLATRMAHVVDKNGKHSTVEITNVTENTANRHFVRRNIITKGSVIETEKGPAKVTSRPGQSGAVHATLLN